jgi:rubrerythrin
MNDHAPAHDPAPAHDDDDARTNDANAEQQQAGAALDRLAEADEPSSRRGALRTLGKLGLGAAALSVATFGSRPKKALAQDAPTAVEIVNFALTLEYLEMFFYQEGINSGVVPSGAMTVFELIEAHEEKHVDVLTQVVNDLGGTPVEFTREDFDFTAGGTLDPFNNYGQFLLLSQGFEDTGVRAYKGQAPNLMGSQYLTPALQIHALEARHAAEVRRLRDQQGAGVEPWIVLDSGTDGTPLEPVYGAGSPSDQFPPEENTTQAGTDLANLGDFTAEEASASYDEPLDMETVRGIASLFIQADAQAVTLDFSSPIGLLNYAYALEQLEAAFYGQARQEFDGEFGDVLDDLWDHERAHREFFEAKINQLGGTPLPALTPDFATLDFSNRSDVIGTALVFEDLGVSAYNGAASLVPTDMPNPLKAAGEIVSIEARHAATLRDLMDPSDMYFGGPNFAIDGEYVINSDNGLDEARGPRAVLDAARPFIENEITVENLPSN